MDARSLLATASPAIPAVAGTPWWIVAAMVVASQGSRWVEGWLDVRDRLRGGRTAADGEGEES